MQIVESKNIKKKDGILDAIFSNFKKSDLSIIDVIPYKRITKEGYLVDKEDHYQAYLKVQTTDLISLNNQDLSNMINQFTNMNRVYTDSLKVLSMTYLTETTEQQNHWKSKINKYRKQLINNPTDEEKNRLETMIRLASDNYRRVRWVEESLSELTFFFVVYGKTIKELESHINDIKRFGGRSLSLELVPRKQLEKIIYRLNNMNSVE